MLPPNCEETRHALLRLPLSERLRVCPIIINVLGVARNGLAQVRVRRKHDNLRACARQALPEGAGYGMLRPCATHAERNCEWPCFGDGEAVRLHRRLWIYQAERFPLAAHGLLVAVIAVAGVGFSSAARGAEQPPSVAAFLTAFAVAFAFFFQLRVADEFKDYADDAAYRPYRAVPRGVVTLRELAIAAVIAVGVQTLLTLWLSPALFWPLAAGWAYLGLMRVEFFAPAWLKAHSLLYMLSHMAILPLIFVYITGCDWLVAGAAPPPGLGWFLAAGYCNGMVIEIGRKMRAPADEEEGVETYSKLWGPGGAAAAWLAALTLAGVCGALAAGAYGGTAPIAGLAGALAVTGLALALRYERLPSSARAGAIEKYSALYVLALYAGVGIAPLLSIG